MLLAAGQRIFFVMSEAAMKESWLLLGLVFGSVGIGFFPAAESREMLSRSSAD
jgi:hypothetical protein